MIISLIYFQTFWQVSFMTGLSAPGGLSAVPDKVLRDNTSIFSWFLYYMVVHFTMRTYVVNQAFLIVEGIWLHQESRQIRNIFYEKTYFPSYVPNMF